jgi:hypothetical protein
MANDSGYDFGTQGYFDHYAQQNPEFLNWKNSLNTSPGAYRTMDENGFERFNNPADYARPDQAYFHIGDGRLAGYNGENYQIYGDAPSNSYNGREQNAYNYGADGTQQRTTKAYNANNDSFWESEWAPVVTGLIAMGGAAYAGVGAAEGAGAGAGAGATAGTTAGTAAGETSLADAMATYAPEFSGDVAASGMGGEASAYGSSSLADMYGSGSSMASSGGSGTGSTFSGVENSGMGMEGSQAGDSLANYDLSGVDQYGGEYGSNVNPSFTAEASNSVAPGGSSMWDDITKYGKQAYSGYNTLKGLYNTFKGPIKGAATIGAGVADAQSAQQNRQMYLDNMNKINGMYQPGTPEYELMKQQMDRQDAAAGRRSQYGVRATDLAAKTAAMRMQALTSSGYGNMMNGAATNNRNAYAGISTGLGQLFGS